MTNKKWMIYGANGYTGQLVVDEALKRGLQPVLAGRSEAVKDMAEKKGLEAKVFNLDSIENVANQLNGFTVIANCAGPFSATAHTVIQACLKSQVHYIDIAGEISVFQFGYSMEEEAKLAGIVVCPGVGFDVIPTDCLAVHLKEKMPDATHMALGFAIQGSKPSIGTAKTGVESLAKGGQVRVDGRMKTVPLAYKEREIDFGFGAMNAITIPWGDVYTAYHSTGILNVEVYFPRSQKGAVKLRKRQKYIRLMKIDWVRKLIQNRIEKIWRPNTHEQRAKAISFVWGEVRNANGDVIQGRFTTVDGYDLTAFGTVEVAQYLLDGHGKGGYFTPSLLMGKGLVEKMPGFSGIEYK
ncbi:saccharopine dehydrogenase NADP-binding domain-containing protein [Caldithrix abyssi]|nr:saccharopine dehydrogenase NADP-binding domain-containing protein [Caldithrix abyssi]